MVGVPIIRKYYLSRKSKIKSCLQKIIFKQLQERPIFVSGSICSMERTFSKSNGNPKTKNIYRERFYISKRNQNQGQILILLLFILPVFAILLNGFGRNLIVLKSKMKQQKACREQTYKAQKEIESGFMHIKKLNPMAAKLRRQKQKATQRLLQAPTPQIKAAAIAELALITKQQILLNSKQKSLILNSRLNAKKHLLKIPGAKKTEKLPPFSLVAKPKDSLSPSYFNSYQMKYKQEIIINWSIRIPQTKFNTTYLRMEGQCGSHIKPVGSKYHVKYSFPDTASLNYL